MRCPHCNTENRPGARFCGHCGQPLEAEAPETLTCPTCGASVKPGARFCPRCGSDLSVFSQPPEPEAAPGRGAPGLSAGPVMAPEPYVASPEPEIPKRPEPALPPERRLRPMWPLAIVVALLSGLVLLCVIVAVAVGPAFGETVPSPPTADPNTPDITITVEEDYISSVIADALPAALAGDAVLDVQPDNLMVMTMNFSLVFVRLEVVVTSKVSVESGRINVAVESIETGGQDILGLLGMDDVSLGQNVTDTIQHGLEGELGAGAHLLSIKTDDQHVILTARWD